MVNTLDWNLTGGTPVNGGRPNLPSPARDRHAWARDPRPLRKLFAEVAALVRTLPDLLGNERHASVFDAHDRSVLARFAGTDASLLLFADVAPAVEVLDRGLSALASTEQARVVGLPCFQSLVLVGEWVDRQTPVGPLVA